MAEKTKLKAPSEQSVKEEVVHLYQIVLKALRSEIVRGIYPVGTPLPSEAALMDRFRVSRHTVRAALRNLREAGLVRSHQGLGTIVEGPGANSGYVHQINTITDLFPVNVETRYDPVTHPIGPLPNWAEPVNNVTDERRWLTITALRYRSGTDTPINELTCFVAARFAGVGRVISMHGGSIYGMIEAIYGETIQEVEQTFVGAKARDGLGSRIGLSDGDPMIEVGRVYRLTSDHNVAVVSFNRYRVEDFSFSMSIRRVKD